MKINKKIVYWFTSIMAIIIIIANWGNNIQGIVYMFNLVKNLAPEPPIYIIKSRMDAIWTNNLSENIGFDLNNDNSTPFSSRTTLIDYCGNVSLINVLVPYDELILQRYQSNFLPLGEQLNLTYSIAIASKKREGNVRIKISSDYSNFSVDSQAASVNKIGETKNIQGIFEQIFEIDLGLHLQDNEALLRIIPSEGKTIQIDCISPKNCKVLNMRYFIINFKDYPKNSQMNLKQMDKNGAISYDSILLPHVNFDKVTIYDLHQINKGFVQVSLPDKTNSSGSISFKPSSCNPQGRVYRTNLP